MKFSKIDDLTRDQHVYLGKEDICYYLGEYTPRAGYAHSETNNIVQNFKKPVDRRGNPEWRYKEQSIQKIAHELRDSLNPDWLRTATLIPMPPSATKDDPKYDDRMVRVLAAMNSDSGFDIRELLIQTASTQPDHTVGDSGHRLTPDERERLMAVDERLASPTPKHIGIFDDVLTNGSHFVAARRVLQRRFPQIEIIGIFFARREVA